MLDFVDHWVIPTIWVALVIWWLIVFVAMIFEGPDDTKHDAR